MKAVWPSSASCIWCVVGLLSVTLGCAGALRERADGARGSRWQPPRTPFPRHRGEAVGRDRGANPFWRRTLLRLQAVATRLSWWVHLLVIARLFGFLLGSEFIASQLFTIHFFYSTIFCFGVYFWLAYQILAYLNFLTQWSRYQRFH